MTPEPAPTPVPPARPCVAVVPSGRVADPGFEEALTELRRRGYPVWRVRQAVAGHAVRDRMAADVLARGCGFAVTADTTIRLWRVGPHRPAGRSCRGTGSGTPGPSCGYHPRAGGPWRRRPGGWPRGS